MLVYMSTHCFIYDIRVMRRRNKKDNCYSYFIGLGDFHDKSHEIIPEQVKELDLIINKCQKDRTKLIIEDVSSPGFGGRCCCNNFFVSSRGGILGGLAKKCKNQGFSCVQNVEYRFCRVASLAPVVNNIRSDFRRIASTSRIYVKNFEQEVNSIIKNISCYNDEKKLNNWYKACISNVTRDMKKLKLKQMSKMSIADYIYYNTRPANRLNFVKKLLTFDSSLVDAKIVHSIVSDPKKQNSIVIAGGSHIKNVSRVLQDIGYTPIYNSKVVVKPYLAKASKGEREPLKNNCVQTAIGTNGFCTRPVPVDLKVLRNFL